MNEEKLAYLMLFCALMLVKNARVSMGELVAAIPFPGRAGYLAGKLASAGAYRVTEGAPSS